VLASCVQDKKIQMAENQPEHGIPSFRAEVTGIGRIPVTSDPESTFCPAHRLASYII